MAAMVLQYLYNLHEVADKHGDGQMADFVEVMLEEQVHGVKECADYVAKLRRVGKGLGVYQFDDVSLPAVDYLLMMGYACCNGIVAGDNAETAVLGSMPVMWMQGRQQI